MEKRYISFDIGGINIKHGIVSEAGKIVEKSVTPTKAHTSEKSLMNAVIELINLYLTENKDVKGIGISTAGQVCIDTGAVISATENLPDWSGMQIKRNIEEKYNLPVYVENDVNAAALGEMWTGVAKGKKDFLCLTLGTGIGGAIVHNGDIFRGQNFAGEFGHIVVEKNGCKCTCGGKGCLEQYASVSAIVRYVKERIKLDSYNDNQINGKWIYDEALKGNDICMEALKRFYDYLSIGLQSLIYTFNPSLIIIGGGFSNEGIKLTAPLEKLLYKAMMPCFLDNLQIRTAKNGNSAGMLGAVYGLLNKN